MNKPVVVSATVTVPERSPVRGLSITATPNAPTAPSTPPQQTVEKAKTKPSLVIRYATAVLKGQPDTLESIAPCFDSNTARIKKHEESWVLESSEFVSCTTGEEVFPIADDIVSRINRILALYCSFTPTLSVDHINWINAEGERLRSLRGSISVNVVSSSGLAELKSISDTQPLGSAVFQVMIRDLAVNEALILHGESGLSWSQVYDIIEFVGGEASIAKSGYANRTQTRTFRQTANHYRHLGSSKKYPLPSNPPTLAQGSEFARSLLKRFISSRLASAA
jgi:hypothetical protein